MSFMTILISMLANHKIKLQVMPKMGCQPDDPNDHFNLPHGLCGYIEVTDGRVVRAGVSLT